MHARGGSVGEALDAQLDVGALAQFDKMQDLIAPILHGSVLSIQLPPSEQAASYGDRLRGAPGILFVDDSRPIGVIDALGQEAIVVKLDRQPGGTTLFAAFDNARLAALIAIWIAENLLLTSH